jgi:hypothetical protein
VSGAEKSRGGWAQRGDDAGRRTAVNPSYQSI